MLFRENEVNLFRIIGPLLRFIQTYGLGETGVISKGC